MRPYFWVGGVKRWPAILRNPPVASLVTSWGFSMSTGARRISVYRKLQPTEKTTQGDYFPETKIWDNSEFLSDVLLLPEKSVRYLLRKNHLLRITIFNDQKWVFPKIMVPPKHPKMIIFSRKTHGCWVPSFLETPKWSYHVYQKSLKMPSSSAGTWWVI